MTAERSPILLATRSSGKLRELSEILRDFDIETTDLEAAGIPVGPDEDAIESYPTFEENALAKARHFHALTGMPTIADDSGLVVDALGGAPGSIEQTELRTQRSGRWRARRRKQSEAYGRIPTHRSRTRAKRGRSSSALGALCVRRGVREFTW